jgi:hypothetical protein
MNEIKALDNWALQTASLIYLENLEDGVYESEITITKSYFEGNHASVGLAGLIYSNHKENEISISGSTFT